MDTSDAPSETVTHEIPGAGENARRLREGTARLAVLLGVSTCGMGIVFVVLLYSQLMDQLASNKSIPVIPMVVMGGAYVLPGVFLAWSGPAMKAGAVSG